MGSDEGSAASGPPLPPGDLRMGLWGQMRGAQLAGHRPPWGSGKAVGPETSFTLFGSISQTCMITCFSKNTVRQQVMEISNNHDVTKSKSKEVVQDRHSGSEVFGDLGPSTSTI